MTASEITSAAGLRRVQVFLLDANGYPDGNQAGANGYPGRGLRGPRSFSINAPAVQKINHVGGDRIIAVDYLPPQEGASGEIRTAASDLATDAILTGTLTEAIGEALAGGEMTDRQGQEVDVAVIVYRQALNTKPGQQSLRQWQMRLFPIARLVPRPSGADQGGADENVYDLIPSISAKYPWGKAFTLTDNEFTEAQAIRLVADYPLMMERFNGDGILTTFNLSWTPISVAKTKVFVNGTAATVSSVNTTAKTMTLSAAPASNAVVVALYETSDPI